MLLNETGPNRPAQLSAGECWSLETTISNSILVNKRNVSSARFDFSSYESVGIAERFGWRSVSWKHSGCLFPVRHYETSTITFNLGNRRHTCPESENVNGKFRVLYANVTYDCIYRRLVGLTGQYKENFKDNGSQISQRQRFAIKELRISLAPDQSTNSSKIDGIQVCGCHPTQQNQSLWRRYSTHLGSTYIQNTSNVSKIAP